MTRKLHLGSWRPSAATRIAAVGVLAGFLLSAIDWGFLALVALAAFLPGVLREIGVLRDKDEFQMEAARRAGYHAYLAGGLLTFLLVAWLRSREPVMMHPEALLEIVLITLWFTWLMSSLFAYWGARTTALRILWIFGGLWFVFNVLSGEGDWVASLMQSLLAVPFLLAALVASRWPRVTGLFLLAASAFFFHFFHLIRAFQEDPTERGRLHVIILFLGPLLASGIALVFSGRVKGKEAQLEKSLES